MNPDTPSTPTVAILVSDAVHGKMLAEDILAPLAAIARLRRIPPASFADGGWRRSLDGASAVITGWHSPGIDATLLDAQPALRMLSHTGASIRRVAPFAAIESGRLRVSQAALPIAEAVAEFVIAQILEQLRFTARQDAETRAGADWAPSRERFVGRLLGAQTVGIVGAGHTGRLVMRLLRPFGCRLLLADPFVGAEQAAALGAERCELDALMAASDIVSLHAPVLPETRGLIGARQLGLLRDGCLLVNTARAAIVDTAALLQRLRAGGLTAVLDVFDDEPLPPADPLRTAPGVVLSPHTAGHTWETYRRQGTMAVAEVGRFLRGEPLQHEVTRAMLASMA